MAFPPTRIYDLAEVLLAQVVARHGADLPARQYVSPGPPPWDCELVAVHCELTAGMGGVVGVQALEPHQQHAAHTMRYGTFVVTIVRCVPVGDTALPSTDRLEAAAAQLFGDAQRMLNSVVAAEKDGDLAGCHGVVFDRWQVLGPEGDMVAGQLRLQLGLTVA